MQAGCAIRSFVRRDSSLASVWLKLAARASSDRASRDPACSGLFVGPTPSSPFVAAASMGGSRITGSAIGLPDQTILLTFTPRTLMLLIGPAGAQKKSD